VPPHGLDRIDDRQRGAFGIERCQDVAQVGLGAQLHGSVGQAQTLGPHPDLGAGFLARYV
jgi:hypothetical protein